MKISKNKLQKMYTDGYNNIEKFVNLSDFITNLAVKEDVSDEQKSLISGGIALGIGMGNIMDRNKHMAIGCIAGVVGTGLVVTAYNKLKKGRDTETED